MEEKIKKEVDDANWDNYLIEGTKVLKNKLGLESTDELLKKESEIVLNKLITLHLEDTDCSMDCESLLRIHKYLFEDIYYFAGEIRNCSLSKNIYTFTDPNLIEIELKTVFKEYKKQIDGVTDIMQYAFVLAPFYYDLIRIHPFREGNGRTIREFVREIVLEKNKTLPFEVELDYSKMDKDNLLLGTKERYLYQSLLEMEFMRGLVPLQKKKNNAKK